MASDIVMNIGEALVGEGNEIAHIDLLIGRQDRAGRDWRSPMPWPTSRQGTPTFWPFSRPNLIAKPATVLITKVTIKGMKQAVQMFGPAQYAVAKAVADCVADGTIPASAGRRPGDRLRRVHPSRCRRQRQDPQVQLRGDQALDPAGHEELAHRRRDHRAERHGQAPLRRVSGSRRRDAPNRCLLVRFS